MITDFIISFPEDQFDPKAIAKAVKEYKKNVVSKERSIGTIGPDVSGIMSLAETSHIVTSMELEDGMIRGQIRVLDTPKGKIIKEIIECGGKPKFSMAYSVHENKIDQIFQISVTGVEK